MKSIHKYHGNNLQPNQSEPNQVEKAHKYRRIMHDAIEARDEPVCVDLIYLANIPKSAKSIHITRCTIFVASLLSSSSSSSSCCWYFAPNLCGKLYNAKNNFSCQQFVCFCTYDRMHFNTKHWFCLQCAMFTLVPLCLCYLVFVDLYRCFSSISFFSCSTMLCVFASNTQLDQFTSTPLVSDVTFKWNLTLKIHLSKTQNQWK